MIMTTIRSFRLGLAVTAGAALMASGINAQGVVVLGGTNIVINPGTSLIAPTNIQIESGGSIENAGQIYLTGNWTNEGSGLVNDAAGEVVFNGTLSQEIAGSSPTQFYNLTVDNGAGLDLLADARVQGQLHFAQGKLNTGSNKLTMNAPAPVAITGADAGSYVDGNLEVYFPSGTQEMKYEIGNGVYAPATVSLNGVTADGYILGYTASGPSLNEDSPEEGASGLDAAARADQHWVFTESDIAYADATIEFDLSNTTNTGNFADYEAAHYDGSDWSFVTSAASGNTVLASEFSSVGGDWAIGEEEDEVSSVNDMGRGAGDLVVFPNPASDRMNFTWTAPAGGSYQVRLFSLTGEIVWQETRWTADGRIRGGMDSSLLASGMYVIEILGNETVVSSLAVVQH
jgi:hypothetical protein